MAKLPEHEERMIDFIDWNLCCDLNIWIERKSGRTEPVIALYNELLKCCTLKKHEAHLLMSLFLQNRDGWQKT